MHKRSLSISNTSAIQQSTQSARTSRPFTDTTRMGAVSSGGYSAVVSNANAFVGAGDNDAAAE
jgi:hypothetical protein